MIGRNLTGLLLASACAGAYAQEGPYISPTMEKVRLSFGAMLIVANSDFRVDGSNGAAGTPFNAEDDFGMTKNKPGPKFQAMVRIEERSRLRFDYFLLDRTGSQDLSRPIEFAGSTLLQGEVANTQINLQILGITYGYSFIHNPTFELAATAGVNVIDFSARAQVQNPAHFVSAREDQAGMFPTLGLDSTWVLSKRFYLDARLQYLKVNVDHFDGSLGFLEFSALYRWRSNIALGLGFNGVRAKIAPTSQSSGGLFDFSTKGPEAFIRVSF